MSHIRVFEGGHSRRPVLPPMEITGSLSPAQPALAYSGSLAVKNQIGNFHVRLLSGSLPGGATLRADNANSAIRVAWPAYTASGTVPITNPDFLSGSTGWELGEGFSVNGGSARLEYKGRGESIAESSVYGAVPVEGTSVTATLNVYQGASSKGSCGGAVQLRWYDANKNFISFDEGNLVNSSKPVSPQVSTVTATRPANAAYVRVATRCFRKWGNLVMSVDLFQWNLGVGDGVGVAEEGTVGPITIQAVDAMGRTAEWTGSIPVMSDEFLAQVASLLHLESDLLDKKGLTWSVNGNAAITSAQKPFGAGSLVLDGTGDYLEAVPMPTQLLVGSMDFCIEAFVRLNELGRLQMIVMHRGAASSPGPQLYVGADNRGGFTVTTTGLFSWAVYTTTVLATGVWYHLAGVKKTYGPADHRLHIFLNGVLEATTTSGSTVVDATGAQIGRDPANASRSLNGWVREVRHTIGAARYTADFTPPTAPFPDP